MLYYAVTIFLCFALRTSSSKIVSDKVDTKVAKCRANCLSNHSTRSIGHIVDSSCRQDPNCYMCWETCNLLHQDIRIWGAMCRSGHLCFPGCQTACKYHKEGYKGGDFSILTADNKWIFPSQLTFSKIEDDVTVEWNEPVSRRRVDVGTVVYAVYVSAHKNHVIDDGEWTEVAQTVETKVVVPRSLLDDYNEVRVVAVISGGVIASKTTPYSMYGELVGDQPRGGTSSKRWPAKILSMVYDVQYGGVDATVTWPALKPYGNAKYEVTWQVKHSSMDVTGHLHTDSNIVVLSLWPDTVYEVQIKCLSSDDEEIISDVVLVDTNDVKPSSSNPDPDPQTCHQKTFRYEVLAGFASGIACSTFLTILAISFRHWCVNKKRRNPFEDRANLKRQDAVRRKNTTVQVNRTTGSISEIVSQKQKDIVKSASSHIVTRACNKALALKSLKSLGSKNSSDGSQSQQDFLLGDDDVFIFPSVLSTEPWSPNYN